MENIMSDTAQQMIEIISKVTRLPSEKIKLEDELVGDLNIDSLQIMELLTVVEEAFSVEITVEDLDPERFQSVQAFIAFVEGKRG